MNTLRISLSPTGERLYLWTASAEAPVQTVISLPQNSAGMYILCQVLRERENSAVHTIGTKGAPTQSQVDALLKALAGQPAAPRRKAPTNLTLEDLGL